MKDIAYARAAQLQAQLSQGNASNGSLGSVGAFSDESGSIDFTRNDGPVQKRISRYLRPELAEKVERVLRELIEADQQEMLERQRAVAAQYTAPLPEHG